MKQQQKEVDSAVFALEGHASLDSQVKLMFAMLGVKSFSIRTSSSKEEGYTTCIFCVFFTVVSCFLLTKVLIFTTSASSNPLEYRAGLEIKSAVLATTLQEASSGKQIQ
jgi:hypothetical protein